ncbi:MAG: hypothetical protein PVI41_05590 [Roseobacter sp.]|jgi:ABC-type microcin C transport system permease subunit YejB
MSKSGKLRQTWSKALLYVEYNVPTGLRTIIGLVLIAGGGLGFLPVLGFWMVPLGIAVVALDAKIVFRSLRGSSQSRATDEKRNEKAEHDK